MQTLARKSLPYPTRRWAHSLPDSPTRYPDPEGASWQAGRGARSRGAMLRQGGRGKEGREARREERNEAGGTGGIEAQGERQSK